MSFAVDHPFGGAVFSPVHMQAENTADLQPCDSMALI
jgi:hypothetical protein